MNLSCGKPPDIYSLPVRGVNVGIGHGTSMASAKRDASVQALEYLRSHGNGAN